MKPDGKLFGQTLGQHLRAYRLRFGEVPELAAYMRLTIVGDGVFRAELVPPDAIPKSPGKDSHVLWYAPAGNPLAAELRQLCADVVAGGRPGKLRRPVAFLFDDAGRFTGWAPTIAQ